MATERNHTVTQKHFTSWRLRLKFPIKKTGWPKPSSSQNFSLEKSKASSKPSPIPQALLQHPLQASDQQVYDGSNQTMTDIPSGTEIGCNFQLETWMAAAEDNDICARKRAPSSTCGLRYHRWHQKACHSPANRGQSLKTTWWLTHAADHTTAWNRWSHTGMPNRPSDCCPT